MLIHGRLILTHNNLMLDEVRSLLQKSLRRQSPLAFQAAKELLAYEKDQLPWKSIVTFLFEDHCLNHVDFYKSLYKQYIRGDKYKCVELLQRGYTCRYAACLQVVALSEEYSPEQGYLRTDLPPVESLAGLVQKETGRIDMDILLANIVKYWQEVDVKALARLFMLVNMAVKVEQRKLTKMGIKYLIASDVKKPSVYHLVLSVVHKHTTDTYMKEVIEVCFKFSVLPDVPQGLIMFAVLTNLAFATVAKDADVECGNLGTIDWKGVTELEEMPPWAVDKHTFRGKFGKQSQHIFLKKFKGESPLSESQLEEFHGPRPKSDIKMFFDEGCICLNDILPSNPIWELTKGMYFKQKPSQQKTAKMTQALYKNLREDEIVIFGGKQKCVDKVEKIVPKSKTGSRKRKMEESHTAKPDIKKQRVDKGISKEGIAADEPKGPTGPLLQLPTGGAKVYTRLDNDTKMVWKGPYKSADKQNLCMFFHTAMSEVFKDKHTLTFEQKGQYIIFPLIQQEYREPVVKLRGFYDCIAKKDVTEENGEFVERSSLGIVQLHKLDPIYLQYVPTSIWAHFAFRYVLNIGDSGLYNAIATIDLSKVYGIDMEENRRQVKGTSLMELIFVKPPNKKSREVIERRLMNRVEEFDQLVTGEFDLNRLQKLYRKYGISDQTERCKARLRNLKMALNNMCKRDLGV